MDTDTVTDMAMERGKPSLVTITMDMVTDTMVKRSAVYLLSCKTSVNLNLIENNLVKRNTPQKEIQNLDVEIKRIKETLLVSVSDAIIKYIIEHTLRGIYKHSLFN